MTKKKKRRKFKIRYIFYTLLIILALLWLIRAIGPREIDDIHPLIPCEQEYIEKSDILWVVPKFHGTDISENQTWCKEILALNKTLGLHGYYHTYKEWDTNNYTNKELADAINIFTKCFGYPPKMFKPPQLHINDHNKKLIENHLELKYWINQFTHRVYHCDNDTTTNEFGGLLPNTFYDYI